MESKQKGRRRKKRSKAAVTKTASPSTVVHDYDDIDEIVLDICAVNVDNPVGHDDITNNNVLETPLTNIYVRFKLDDDIDSTTLKTESPNTYNAGALDDDIDDSVLKTSSESTHRSVEHDNEVIDDAVFKTALLKSASPNTDSPNEHANTVSKNTSLSVDSIVNHSKPSKHDIDNSVLETAASNSESPVEHSDDDVDNNVVKTASLNGNSLVEHSDNDIGHSVLKTVAPNVENTVVHSSDDVDDNVVKTVSSNADSLVEHSDDDIDDTVSKPRVYDSQGYVKKSYIDFYGGDSDSTEEDTGKGDEVTVGYDEQEVGVNSCESLSSRWFPSDAIKTFEAHDEVEQLTSQLDAVCLEHSSGSDLEGVWDSSDLEGSDEPDLVDYDCSENCGGDEPSEESALDCAKPDCDESSESKDAEVSCINTDESLKESSLAKSDCNGSSERKDEQVHCSDKPVICGDRDEPLKENLLDCALPDCDETSESKEEQVLCDQTLKETDKGSESKDERVLCTDKDEPLKESSCDCTKPDCEGGCVTKTKILLCKRCQEPAVEMVLQCCNCEEWLHHKCTPLTLEEFEMCSNRGPKSIRYKCKECQENQGKLNSMLLTCTFVFSL